MPDWIVISITTLSDEISVTSDRQTETDRETHNIPIVLYRKQTKHTSI